MPQYLTTIPRTPFGPFALVWSHHRGRPRLLRVLMPNPGGSGIERASREFRKASRLSCPEIDELASRIEASLRGESHAFPLEIARMDQCAPFQRAVLRAEHKVPRGRVTSYGGLAKKVGRPGGARAVGRALATNPFPILVPCHRAVRSDGSLGGYQGGAEMKRALLEMEGVVFSERDRVVL